MGGLPTLPLELRRGVRASSEPAGTLAGFTSQDHVVLAIPDRTRSLPLQHALQTLTERIPNHQIVVGLGLHRRMSSEEMESLSPWSAIQHNPDDCVPTMEVMGVPGAVGRPLKDADWSISIGVCELHQYAGLSGGHKGIAVGCGGRETIHALHHRDRIMKAGVEVGRIDGNPFRDAIDLLGRAAGCHLALNWVPSLETWMAGPPEKVVRTALSQMAPWQVVPAAAPGARLRVPPPKARSLYQASRAATYLSASPRPPLIPGAILALEASCEEGLGTEEGFTRALHSCAPPWNDLIEGPAPKGAGAQRAVMIALLAKKYSLRVYGCQQPEALRSAGIWASPEPAPLEPNWLDIPLPFANLPQLPETQ